MSDLPAAPPPESRTPLETAIERVLDEARKARMGPGDPHYRYLISVMAASNTFDGMSARHARKAELHSATVRDATAEIQHVTRRIERFTEVVGDDVARRATFLQEIETRTGRIERAVTVDLRSTVARYGIGLATVLVAVMLIGAGVGYALGDRHSFGSFVSRERQLQDLVGLDEAAAHLWAYILRWNDPQAGARACRTGPVNVEDGRRVCVMKFLTAPDTDAR